MSLIGTNSLKNPGRYGGRMPNELIILGMGSTRKSCPFNNKDVPRWSCNPGYIQIAEMSGYLTKVFMAHGQHDRPAYNKKDNTFSHWVKAYNIEQMNLLTEHGVEILNIHRIKGLKHKMYPLKRIDQKFKSDGFFSNTICYMLAYALDQSTKVVDGKLQLKPDGFHKIRIFGVDMLTKDEYELEKGGIEFWIGYAKGLGIDVEICPGSAVTKTCTGQPYGMKLAVLKDIDPWKMLELADKSTMWQDQAMPTKKQMAEIRKNLNRTIL